MNSQRLPQTDSIQELANFWDTHDVTEFEDELEEVGERVFGREIEITVHAPARSRMQAADAAILPHERLEAESD
jgi:hypothetical protein